MRKKNLLSKKFGNLTVITPLANNKDGRAMWLCECDCGDTIEMNSKYLLSGKTTGCKNCRAKGINEVGKIFGYWFVIKRLESDKYGFARFLCKCINSINNNDDKDTTTKTECGAKSAVNGRALRSGQSKSCTKCVHQMAGKKIYDANSIDLVGQSFGRLVVLARLIESGTGRRRWKCICTCGSEKITIVRQEALFGKKARPIRSCGCLQREAVIGNIHRITHGLSSHPLHGIWSGIKGRSESSKSPAFLRYGGRGIKLCAEWQNFESFYNWAIKNGWQQGLTIDRIDNDGDYAPDNCQIITRLENVLKMQRDKGRATFLHGRQINIHAVSLETAVPYLSCQKLIKAGYSPNDIMAYSRLEFFQRQAVGKSMKTGNPIQMFEASMIKRVVKNPKKKASELGSYRAMISRCYNPKDPSYKNYGAKNIKVCVAWRKSFPEFLLDMGPKPEPKNKFAIDRINRFGDYTPENCRWLSISENSKKRD